jgi:radical SAM superfamily enzyme YgiQ (UPF0313 family)
MPNITEYENLDAQNEFLEAAMHDCFPSGQLRRLLLVAPPDADKTIFKYDMAVRKRYSNYPPYGLAVLARHLQKDGVEVRLINLNHEVLKAANHAESEEDFDFEKSWRTPLEEAMLEFKPDCVGVTCMFTMGHQSLTDTCGWLKDFGVPIITGGVHVSNDLAKVVAEVPGIRFAFFKEADLTIRRFVKVARHEEKPAYLEKVVVIRGNQAVKIKGEGKPQTEDFDILPAYELFPVSEYADYGVIGSFYHLTKPGTKFATVLSNRGCRARCTFCSVATFNGQGVRARSVDSVIEELKVLKYKYGIGHFMWLDDDLLADSSRCLELFNRMVEEKLDMTWDATNGVIASACSPEIVKAAAASGCIGLHIGMESGNDEILKAIRKPSGVKHFLKAAKIFRESESIYASVFLMIGFPKETMSMMGDTLRVAKEMDLDWYSLGLLQPLPNTPIYDQMKEMGLLTDRGTKGRFMIGSFGGMSEREKTATFSGASFEDAFGAIAPDAIPDDSQLTDIWFYMDYHLNFHRLFTENRPRKIHQQLVKLEKIANILSPNHAFALYFLALLQKRVFGAPEPEILERLRAELKRSEYWSYRMEQFGLSISQLEIPADRLAQVA